MVQKLSRHRKELLRILEAKIGECYNPHSTTMTARDWGSYYEMEKGRRFNYPVTYLDMKGDKTKNPIFADPKFYEDADERVLMTAYYAFGANQLPVFWNLNKILEYLEKEYGLVIDEAEQ